MGEQQSGHEGGDEPIENVYGSLEGPEGAELQELSAEVRLAAQQLEAVALEYASRPGEVDEGMLSDFMHELRLLDLPREKLIQALELAAENAEGGISTGRANSMDPFLDDAYPEDEAERIKTEYAAEGLRSSRATILLLLALKQLELGI